jgi:hypothetical protein
MFLLLTILIHTVIFGFIITHSIGKFSCICIRYLSIVIVLYLILSDRCQALVPVDKQPTTTYLHANQKVKL